MLDFFHHDEERPKKKRGWAFFWWSALLMVMAAACFVSWVGSFYVIGHPEEPRCYEILKKLKKLEPPKRFEVTKAPEGKFLTPTGLLERYGDLGPAHLAKANSDLLRAYLMNYRENKTPPVYVTGRYDVIATRPLTAGDMFRSGVVAVAQAKDKSQLVLEYVFTATPETVPKIQAMLPTGGDFRLERSHDVSALIHVARLSDGRMQFTAVPLPYGSWKVSKGEGSFTLASPEELENGNPARKINADPDLVLNIKAGLPVVGEAQLARGLEAYAGFRRKLLANAGDDESALMGPELVRFEPDQTKTRNVPSARVVQLPTANPGARAATPAAPVDPKAAAATPPARQIPTPAPTVPLPPRAIVRPATAPPPQPVARPLTTSEASALVEGFSPAEPAVLTGDFVVTGVLGRRVAMRTLDSLRDKAADPTKPGSSAALIVVDFPEGAKPPGKNSTVSRESADGFIIRDVIRGKNGQITIVTEGS